MTACKEEKTWSTSLPETVIIYKFTIFHWLSARLDRHSVELHYGTVLTHLPARVAVRQPFSHSQTSRYPPADCGNWLVLKKLLANHGAPFSETFAFYFLLFLLSFHVVALPLIKLHRSQPIRFTNAFVFIIKSKIRLQQKFIQVAITWMEAIRGGRTSPWLSPWTMVITPTVRVVRPQEFWYTYRLSCKFNKRKRHCTLAVGRQLYLHFRFSTCSWLTAWRYCMNNQWTPVFFESSTLWTVGLMFYRKKQRN